MGWEPRLKFLLRQETCQLSSSKHNTKALLNKNIMWTILSLHVTITHSLDSVRSGRNKKIQFSNSIHLIDTAVTLKLGHGSMKWCSSMEVTIMQSLKDIASIQQSQQQQKPTLPFLLPRKASWLGKQ